MKKEVLFGLTMAGTMSLIMMTYNNLLMFGFTKQTLMIIIKNWWFGFLCGFLLMNIFVFKLAFKIKKTICKKENKWTENVLLPTIIVSIMVCLMGFITTIRYVGFVDNFLQIYLFAILRSFFFAWFIQVCFVGPFLRSIFFKRYF